MSKTKNTKSALLMSFTSLLLCFAMLIGSTFAWFTDSATASVNTIKSGKLDVQLLDEHGSSLEGQTLKWVRATAAADEAELVGSEDILWEPGCTYNLQPIVIKNNGNLALKYKIVISGIQGDDKLNEAIEWTINNNGQTYGVDQEVSLAAGDSDTLTISGHMKESAGNEYQGLSIDGIAITVNATQLEYEYDSTTNEYDADATYPVTDADELKTALANGGIVSIKKNITVDADAGAAADRITINIPTTLNLDAKLVVPGELEPTANWAAVFIQADTVIDATENGGIQCLNKENGECGPYVANIINGANVTVNGGTYYGGGTTFQVQEGTLTINGGHFEVTSFGAPYDYNFLLNCVDANYANGTAKIIVTGGTFVNFNPADNAAEGAGTNFVAEGYTVVSETKGNGDIWYTVVPAA